MMRTKTNSNMLSLLGKPLCVALLLIGLFGLIWLRSSVTTVAYDLRTLEDKKMDALKETKILLANRAKLMSLEKLDVSFKTNTHGEATFADYVFPDRTRVVHITRSRGPETYKASLDVGSRN
jgi:hypothetical protein